MLIHTKNIPPEGKQLEFLLDSSHLHQRVAEVTESLEPGAVPPPDYQFAGGLPVSLFLTIEGTTVTVRGEVRASYQTICGRCASEVAVEATVPVAMFLKPRPREEGCDDEDIAYGFYDDNEVDCAVLAEECVILSLPANPLCREDCRGICPECGENLNTASCGCRREPEGDERFAVLRNLKLH